MTYSWTTRLCTVALLVGAWALWMRGIDAEADAVFAAGGDAGMYGVGNIVVTVLLIPSALLALLSLGLARSASAAGVVPAVLAAAVTLVVGGWLAYAFLTAGHPPRVDETVADARYLAGTVALLASAVCSGLAALATVRLQREETDRLVAATGATA